MACGRLATFALWGIGALVISGALSGCGVVSGAASLTATGVGVAVGVAKTGGKLAVGTAGAAGRMVFHKRDGHCYTRDQDGRESPISCH